MANEFDAESLKRDCDRINRRFFWLTAATVLGLSGIVLACTLLALSIPETAAVVAISAWFVAAPWAIGYLGALTTRMERKADMTIRLSAHAAKLYDDAAPVIKDAAEVLKSFRDLVDQVKGQRPDRIIDFIDRLQKSGTVEKVTSSLEQIAAKIHGAVEQSKNLLDNL